MFAVTGYFVLQANKEWEVPYHDALYVVTATYPCISYVLKVMLYTKHSKSAPSNKLADSIQRDNAGLRGKK